MNAIPYHFSESATEIDWGSLLGWVLAIATDALLWAGILRIAGVL